MTLYFIQNFENLQNKEKQYIEENNVTILDNNVSIS